MPDFSIFILIIFLSSISWNSWKLNEKQIATFFVCPNFKCQAKHQPKSFIDSKDEKKYRLLMTCISCSQRGYFKVDTFHQLKCETCHNAIIYDDLSDIFFKKKPTTTKWYRLHKNEGRNFSNEILNPCPHCNTYGAKTYVPELPEKERGITTTKPRDNIIWPVFFLFLLLIIILWILW